MTYFKDSNTKPLAIAVVVLSILLVACIVWFALIPAVAPAKNDVYPIAMVVVDLDYDNDIVTCQTITGLLYSFYGCEDWQHGDIAAMIMDTMGTENVRDDEILSIKYDGWLNGWELYWGL